jgi:hypothetical protein
MVTAIAAALARTLRGYWRLPAPPVERDAPHFEGKSQAQYSRLTLTLQRREAPKVEKRALASGFNLQREVVLDPHLRDLVALSLEPIEVTLLVLQDMIGEFARARILEFRRWSCFRQLGRRHVGVQLRS